MLYYIHGYLSSPDGTKGQLFKQKLQAIPIKYRDVEPEDLVISDCLMEIKKVIKDDNNPVLIGSSLGGLLATKIALDTPVKTLILLNPALIPPFVDIHSITDMPLRILKDMKDDRLFSLKLNTDIIIFVGTNDNVVPNKWSIEFAKSQEATIHFLHDDHQFSNYVHLFPDMIKNMLT